MGRRYQPSNMPTNWQEQRSSIGDIHVDKALGDLNKWCKSTVNALTHYNPTRMKTLHMLFNDDTVAKLSQVRGMVDPMTNIKAYAIQERVILTIDFEGELIPPVQSEFLDVYPDRITPLLTYVEQVRAIHDRYEEAKAVLKWLNRNATPGAIRYYWPTAMKLTPKAKIWEDLQDVPSRYSEPTGIGDWLQALRDAAATVVNATLLPADAAPRAKGHMTLTFAPKKVEVGATQSYQTDNMTYNV